jgi:hypothetical protein
LARPGLFTSASPSTDAAPHTAHEQTEAFALRAELERAASAPPALQQLPDDAERERRYRVARSALARLQTYSVHHFGPSDAYGKGWTALRRRALAEDMKKLGEEG